MYKNELRCVCLDSNSSWFSMMAPGLSHEADQLCHVDLSHRSSENISKQIWARKVRKKERKQKVNYKHITRQHSPSTFELKPFACFDMMKTHFENEKNHCFPKRMICVMFNNHLCYELFLSFLILISLPTWTFPFQRKLHEIYHFPIAFYLGRAIFLGAVRWQTKSQWFIKLKYRLG